jgi:Recombination endonuclease VII
MKKKVKNIANIRPGTFRCSSCGHDKDNITEGSFYLNRFTKDGYRLQVNTYCITCATRISKELSHIKRQIKQQHPQPPYGHPCDMCKKPVYPHKKKVPTGVDGTWGWQCDHDHETLTFRGWLCKKCNTGLGAIGDTKEAILNALAYITKTP